MGNDIGSPVLASPQQQVPENLMSARCIHTGNTPLKTLTDGTDTTPAVTETYFSEVNIPAPMLVNGLALLNGSLVAGNVFLILYNKDGVVVATSASTAQAGAAALQRIPFTKAQRLPAGTYYVGCQFNNVGARFRSHAVGNFGANKKTGEVYGTATKITPPTTLTTNLGPIGTLY